MPLALENALERMMALMMDGKTVGHNVHLQWQGLKVLRRDCKPFTPARLNANTKGDWLVSSSRELRYRVFVNKQGVHPVL